MIYLDHAATTPCRPEVVEAMRPYHGEVFGNPSSVHGTGQEARKALDESRDRVARALGAKAEEIVFTGSGTEADNMVLVGAFLQCRSQKRHLITAATEHHAVLHTAEWLREHLGAELTVLPVDGDGRVDPDDVKAAIRPDTFLVSIMAANNEIGTLAPIPEIGAICREAGVLFHTDAVQWAGALPLDVKEWNVDCLVLTAHKFYGPKGVGALYLRRGVRIKPLIHGGGQERGRRAGTENLAGIMGLAEALDLDLKEQSESVPRISALRNRLVDRVLEIRGAVLNGPRRARLPNNVNVSFPGVESDLVVLSMDLEGVACSSGSACTAGAVEPSHVIKALGVSHLRQISAVRLSLGRSTTEEEVDTAAATLEKVIARIRSHATPVVTTAR